MLASPIRSRRPAMPPCARRRRPCIARSRALRDRCAACARRARPAEQEPTRQLEARPIASVAFQLYMAPVMLEDTAMSTRFSRWGDGFFVRVARKYTMEADLTANAEVRLKLGGASITIEPVEVSRKRRARRPLSYYLDQSHPTSRDHEVTTGPARGREDID